MLRYRPLARSLAKRARLVPNIQTRFLRVRPMDRHKTADSLPPAPLPSFTEQSTPSPVPDKNSIENDFGSLLQRKTSAKSKFSKSPPKAKEDSWLAEFEHKSPAQIERDMKAKFEKDGIEYDPMFVQRLIEQSKHEEKVTKKLMEEDTSVDEVTREEIIGLLDSLLEESMEFIENQKPDPSKEDRINDQINDILMSSSKPESLANAFVSADELAEELRADEPNKLPIFLRAMDLPENERMKKLIPIEYISSFFTISVQILDEKLRDECIYLSGKMIYTTTELRPDPINESFYIKALLQRNLFEEATKLFETRRIKPDVKNHRFWLDLGATIYLKQYETEKAEEIAIEIKEKFSYLHPNLATEFVSAYLAQGNTEKAFEWWSEMKLVMDEYGLTESIQAPETQILDDEELVYAYHNRVEPVTFSNVTDVVMDFFKFGAFDEGMQIIEIATRRDKIYLYNVTKTFINNVSYPGREALFQVIKNAKENKYHPSISRFVAKELQSYQPTKSTSFQEVAILDEIISTLKLTATTKKLNKDQRTKLTSIISSISIGSKLTTYECCDLIRLLLLSKSRKSYTLVSKVLTEMNKSLELNRQGKEYGIFPPANSPVYLVLIQLFGRRRNPGFSEIESILALMKSLNIPIYTIVANQVILTYRRSKRFTKAATFIDEYMGQEYFKPTSELYINILKTYQDSLVTASDDLKDNFDYKNNVIFTERLDNLRRLFKIMIQTPSWDFNEVFFQQTLLTFMKFSDTPTIICVLQYYGMDLNRDLTKDLLLLIKVILESLLIKMESKLTAEQKETIEEKLLLFRQESGILSVGEMIKSDVPLNWRDGASLFLRFMDLFNYKPSNKSLSDPYWSTISKEQHEKYKAEFEKKLLEMQAFYGLSEVKIDEIV